MDIIEPDVIFYGMVDQDGYLWSRPSKEEAIEAAFSYYQDKPFTLSPVYAVVVEEEQEKFNGY